MFINKVFLFSLITLLVSCVDLEALKNLSLELNFDPESSDADDFSDSEKIHYGSNFGYRCEDADGLSAGSNVMNEGACFTSTEAIERAKILCASDLHPVSNKPMSLVSVSNWSQCEMIPEELGRNFGFRCEDIDGLSAGSNISYGEECISSSIVTYAARYFCDDENHPVSGKKMFLVSVSNWSACQQ